MNTNKITDWTIGECCTKATGVVLSHFRGTAAEVQILLLKMVKQLKNIDSGEYVHGTETLKELTSEHEEYTAAAVFWSYEVKITAKETPTNVNGLIRLDFAPFWFLAGLLSPSAISG